jgi:hypothetical protein
VSMVERECVCVYDRESVCEWVCVCVYVVCMFKIYGILQSIIFFYMKQYTQGYHRKTEKFFVRKEKSFIGSASDYFLMTRQKESKAQQLRVKKIIPKVKNAFTNYL